MAAPFYTAADYLSALQALMPRGRVWPRDSDATQTKALSGLTPTCARQNIAANNLLVDAFPSSTFQLLPEWEETLGLPDPCAGSSPTVQGRRSQVVTRFTGIGGQSVAYMTAFALTLGYSITISQFVPARSGLLRAGQPLNGSAWAHAWRVTAPLNTTFAFRAGLSTAGEPLTTIGNTVLECELRAIAPAHTTVFFVYS